MTKIIYKICDQADWRTAEAAGFYAGAPVDLKDGFIHFSTATQVEETAARHFSGRDGLVLLSVNASALGEQLKWEPSRGGDLFPHLYGHLTTDTVVKVEELPWVDGAHQFSELER